MLFDKLRYRIDLVPADQLVIERFPELAEHKEFSDPAQDLILRAAIFATDEGSPFVQGHRDDYEKKIKKIFEHLKISDETLCSDIVNGIERTFEAMVNRYFIMCDNLAYVMWSDKFRNFHFIGLALREPPNMANLSADMAKRAALGKQQQDIYRELIELEEKIFPDTFTRRVVKEQVAKIMQIPEKMAREKGRF